ncbi:MAG: hypothetical protein AAGB51_04760 [Planctomycetota bacterium]
MEPAHLKQLMGHATIEMTMRIYVHLGLMASAMAVSRAEPIPLQVPQPSQAIRFVPA